LAFKIGAIDLQSARTRVTRDLLPQGLLDLGMDQKNQMTAHFFNLDRESGLEI